jgi:hypothetical protein
MHERINTDCLSGHILYKILWDLRFILFIGRDIVEAFRLSLREYPLVQRSGFGLEMDDPVYLLGILEEVGILKKGQMLSEENACSFHINQVICDESISSIQDALCAAVSSSSHFPEDGSIISFQFCQQKEVHFTRQIPGTNFEFPHNGVIFAEKLFRANMFITYKIKHYLVVHCVGEAFFLSNSLSTSQCGHFLPETREIPETEAMELFRAHAHTIVFECVGNVFPPQASSASDHWVPQPPPQASCAQVGWVPSPPPLPPQCASGPWGPPPAFPPPPPQCASGPWAPPPSQLPQCASVASVAPVPQPPARYKFDYSSGKFTTNRIYTCPINHTTTGQWEYTYYVCKDVIFTAKGSMKKDGRWDETIYKYNDESLIRLMLQERLKEAYNKFISEKSSSLE